ncbi:CRP/FNR family transcriptional regulator [Wenyingzhuangia heitensis]|uniref:CRP/FNR family transcriptional regulator n=1 Tax=Wenyingzhuangia heitensis TaxID=1487859 RepID=A0ABX0U748_9FLAO|nr:Crp/Fnr family transcriptional regulator [Wenyingzhuangia heitensis]NIJ44622.1 CRP/FNR family transcriptional regulator [Wenyingzhuangia heitensis]
MITELELHYGYLFEKELLQEISNVGTIKEVKAGTTLMNIGQYIKSMPLLIDGAIKILREDDEGDELLLYFLEKGDTCAMTMSCCTGNKKSEIKAVTELDTKLLMVPVEKMDEWIGKYKSWRNFVLNSYHNRLMEMLEAIDNIAFKKMDERLLKYLKDKVAVTGSTTIKSTHQEIAYELHTSRVVISRLLKKLEQQGIIELHRNSLNVL